MEAVSPGPGTRRESNQRAEVALHTDRRFGKWYFLIDSVRERTEGSRLLKRVTGTPLLQARAQRGPSWWDVPREAELCADRRGLSKIT